MFAIDQVAPIEDDVKEKIMHERMRYGHIYETLEKYLHEHVSGVSSNPKITGNTIMLGGRIGVQLLLERERL